MYHQRAYEPVNIFNAHAAGAANDTKDFKDCLRSESEIDEEYTALFKGQPVCSISKARRLQRRAEVYRYHIRGVSCSILPFPSCNLLAYIFTPIDNIYSEASEAPRHKTASLPVGFGGW